MLSIEEKQEIRQELHAAFIDRCRAANEKDKGESLKRYDNRLTDEGLALLVMGMTADGILQAQWNFETPGRQLRVLWHGKLVSPYGQSSSYREWQETGALAFEIWQGETLVACKQLKAGFTPDTFMDSLTRFISKYRKGVSDDGDTTSRSPDD